MTNEELVEQAEREFVEHAELSWKLIEWKIAYYMPEFVHSSWRKHVEISDGDYDASEQRYLTLCRKLGKPNTLVHKTYPGFEDLDYSRAMLEVDKTRPSAQLVMNKLSKPKPRKRKCS